MRENSGRIYAGDSMAMRSKKRSLKFEWVDNLRQAAVQEF